MGILDPILNPQPTKERNSASFGAFRYIMEKEGRKLISANNFSLPPSTPVNLTAFGQLVGTGAAVAANPGRACYVKNVMISTDGPVMATVNFNTGQFGYINGLSASGALSGAASGFTVIIPSGVSTIPIDAVVYEGCSISVKTESIGAIGTVAPNTRCNFQYSEFTADFNYGAKFVMLVIGDSRTWGGNMGLDPSGLPYFGNTHYTFRLRDQLRAAGIDVRLVNMGINGYTTRNISDALAAGGYVEGIPFDLLIIDAQTNDPGPGITTSQHTANIQKCIDFRDRNNPNASMIINNCTKSDVTAHTDASVQPFRDALRTYISSYNGNNPHGAKIWFYDQSQAFPLAATASTDTNFQNSERSTGARLHPSGLGHGLMWSNTNGDVDNGIASGQPSGLKEVIKLTKFYTDNAKS